MMPKSTAKAATKPAKPYDDFPLFPHASGRWAKKIRGKLHYFGKWDDPDAALNKYLDERDDLHAGRTPRSRRGGLEVRDLVNRFLSLKLSQLESGELHQSSYAQYYRVCQTVVEQFGARRLVDDLRAEDFSQLRGKLSKGLSLRELGKRIQLVRSLFKYGFDAELMDKPVRFGPEFRRPGRKVMKRVTAATPRPMLNADQIKAMIEKASKPMKAMLYLGINCGFGNTDCADLTFSALDLDGGFHNFPRPKTGVARRCPLWPETVQALREAIEVRPTPRDKADAELVFVTTHGRRWVRYRLNADQTKGTWSDGVGQEFKKLLKACGFDKKGMSFYTLRHVFRTTADEIADRPAVDNITGHEDGGDMRTHYVHHVADARLKVVTDHVRDWLNPEREAGDVLAKIGKAS